ncbi:uncharacterized protein YeaO (DUF488 family) [Stackebrandtia albiflava]|uniref:Uncharacterized protein YeaO (DUF488 family) n=1 Tax=Stackebrandtia albiflava TaxID=406432 RepID=A0A562VBF3_9ACTN|nr:DUF488 family protein [Stackebrandtia albiflava]TWJ15214.1 uncharacterized protein YeaO (DUF488 family) [Stackebrandtia albiflava]
MDTTGIGLRRVYEPPETHDGLRVLVDRLWPRGLSRADAALDEWLKDVAPSTELRRWFHHRPERHDEFVRRYEAELHDEAHTDALRWIGERASRGPVTLLTASRDVDGGHVPVIVAALRELPPGRSHSSSDSDSRRGRHWT